MLGNSKLTAFVATTKPDAARMFYETKLGLKFLRDDGFALVFDANGTTLRVAKVQKFTPAPFTVLGWQVDSMDDALAGLARNDITVERYPFLEHDRRGVVTFGTGDQVAWFRDPDGNTLSVAEMSGKA